jgi:hypothetical protein
VAPRTIQRYVRYLLVEDTIPFVDVRDVALLLICPLPGELVAFVDTSHE